MSDPDLDSGLSATTQTLVLDHADGKLQTADGESVYFQLWRPKDPRGVLLFVHGLAEHSGRYGYPIEYFTRRGWICAALDLRGHGRSSGKRVHVERFADYVADVRLVRERLVTKLPDLPLFQVGHSMGGLITLLDALDAPVELTGAVVSSPALGVPAEAEPGFLLALIARVLNRIAPRVLLPGIEPGAISRDPQVVQAYLDDPLVSRRVTPRWLAAIRQAMEEAHQRAASLSLDLLVMQSGDDTLVDPQSAERWARAAPDDRITWKLWPGLYHEMFNEPERAEVLGFLEQWLQDQLGETTSG